jgi:hypothetical protein
VAKIDREDQAGRDTRRRTLCFSKREAEHARTVISRASLKDFIRDQALNLRWEAHIKGAYCKPIEIESASPSMKPESVEPSFAISMKISPGPPSSYIPTMM